MSGAFIPFHGHPFVNLGDRILWQRVVGEILDRLSSKRLTADEDASLFPFNQHAIAFVISNDHFSAIRIGNGEHEFRRSVVAIVLRGVSVLEGDGVFRIAAAANGNRSIGLSIELQRPVADIDVVGTPIGQLAARVLVPPAELIVAVGVAATLAVLAGQVPVVDFGCGSEPAIPVEFLRHIDDRNRWARRRTTNRCLKAIDFAKPTLGNDGHRLDEQVERASLLRAHLNNTVGVLLYLANQLAFVDRQGQWLLAVDVFAGQHRFHQRLGVPVVGRGNMNDVDVITIQ